MNRENLSVILQALGKLLYKYPDAEFLSDIKDAGLFDKIPYESYNSMFNDGQKLLKTWQNSDGAYDECISDYQDLFIGVRDKVKTPVWESLYTAPEPMMFADCTLKARLWYDRYGMEIKNIRHEPDDHMGIELMFAGYLLNNAPEDADRFFSEHIARWYERFFDSMAAHALTPLYKGLAMVLHGICSDYEKEIAAKV